MKLLVALFTALAASASAETLRIATGGHYPPYISDPATPQATGLDKDLLDEICARGGYDCVWVDLPMGDIFQALARGDVDVVTGGFGYSVERDALVDFTCPYVTRGDGTGHFIAAREDVDLITARIAALEQSLYQASMEQAQRDVRAYATEDAALDALISGDVDVVFGSHNMLDMARGRGGLFDLGEYPTFSRGTVLGVAETAPALRVTLDALLADISADGTLSQMHLRWLGEDLGDVISRCTSIDALT
ncbi:Arginine-binding periplasmic protein [Nymphon striatum]|nr:Arginine-binding periplasmic protein [Nymphon striatum]